MGRLSAILGLVLAYGCGQTAPESKPASGAAETGVNAAREPAVQGSVPRPDPTTPVKATESPSTPEPPTPKTESNLPETKQGIESENDEFRRGDVPQQAAGAFLVDTQCAWGEQTDEQHAEVGCAVVRPKAAALALAGGKTALIWRVEDQNGQAVTAEQLAVAKPGFDVVFKMPVAATPGMTVRVSGELDGQQITSLRALKDALKGLADKATVDCLVTKREMSCVKKYLAPLTPDALKAAAIDALGGKYVTLPEGRPQDSVAVDGYVKGQMEVAAAGGANLFCGDDGLKNVPFPQSLSLSVERDARTLAWGNGETACFLAFDKSLAVLAGVTLYSDSMLGGPNHEGKPACFFIRVKEDEDSGSKLLIIRNPAANQTKKDSDVFAANLFATMKLHECP